MTLVQMLPFTINNPNLPQIPVADLTLLQPYEADAWEHWLLGGTSASLTGGVNSRVLTAGNDAPDYSAGYVTVSQASGNGLASALPDPVAGLQVTLCAVVRRSATTAGSWFPFGNLSTPTDGVSPFASGAGNLLITGRGLTGLSSRDTGTSWPASQWVFMGLALDFASVTRRATFLRGGAPVFEVNPTGAYVPNTDAPFALGGRYFSTALAADIDFAEFMLFQGAKTAADLNAIYARTKIRLSGRGISVV